MIDDRWTLDEGYRIELFAEQEAFPRRTSLALWGRELPFADEELRRRIHEVLLVATTDGGELVGVSTAYLRQNEQLAMDLWYYRAFVGERAPAEQRRRQPRPDRPRPPRAAVRQRQPTRAPGMVYEVENEGLKRHFDDALWLPTDFTFIGENERGDHVRVRYFPGALAPEPALGGG